MTNTYYENKRVVFNATHLVYELADASYDEDGQPNDLSATSNLGHTLVEVKENLQALINDIENWEREELVIHLTQ